MTYCLGDCSGDAAVSVAVSLTNGGLASAIGGCSIKLHSGLVETVGIIHCSVGWRPAVGPPQQLYLLWLSLLLSTLFNDCHSKLRRHGIRMFADDHELIPSYPPILRSETYLVRRLRTKASDSRWRERVKANIALGV